jgi:DNA-binding CsgD family transcriptional regulator
MPIFSKLAFSSFSEAEKLLKASFEKLGINHFSYTYYGEDFHNETPLNYDYATQSVRRWHKYFHAMQYEGADDVSQRIRNSVLPEMWVVAEQYKQATGRAKKMLSEALMEIEPYMQSGLSLPIHGPANEFSIFTVRHTDIRKLLAEQPCLPGVLLQMGLQYHDKINQLLLKKVSVTVDCPFTERELQCLQFVNANKDAQQTADELGISKRTVDFHLQNVNKKLNVKNKFSALKIALHNSWLD